MFFQMVAAAIFLTAFLGLSCQSNTGSVQGLSISKTQYATRVSCKLPTAIVYGRRVEKCRRWNVLCKSAELDDDGSQLYSEVSTAFFTDISSTDIRSGSELSSSYSSSTSTILDDKFDQKGTIIDPDSNSNSNSNLSGLTSPLLSKSFLLLNSVAIIWGTQHVVIKTALEDFPSPSVLNFWRFSLSFLLFLPAFFTVLVSKLRSSKNVLNFKRQSTSTFL